MSETVKNSSRKHIRLERSNGIATLIIDRPDKRNALGRQTIEELLNGLAAIERDDSVRVIVMTGAGRKAFVSGADLDELSTAFTSPESARAYDEEITRLYQAMANCKTPIVARMAGHAIGGGCLLALACDIRIAAAEIEIGFPIALIGLMLSPYEHELILESVTLSRAKELMFSGRRILADEAKSVGLVDIVVPREDLDSAASALARQIASGAPLAISAAKSLLNAIRRRKDVEAVALKAYQAVYSSSDLAEGLDAIQAKRQPLFTGE